MSSSALERPAPPRRPVLFYWLPTLLWLCVLAVFSSDTFSAEHTGRVLEKILQLFYGHVSDAAFRDIHFLVRKGAHLFSYGLLSAFAFFTWRATFPLPRVWAMRWSLLALLTTLIAGSADEIHQSFVPSRTSAVHDVGIDVLGGVLFQIVIALWLCLRAGRKTTRSQFPATK